MSIKKCLLLNCLGFCLAGLLWGELGYVLEVSHFSFIFLVMIWSGVVLAQIIDVDRVKNTLKAIMAGLLGHMILSAAFWFAYYYIAELSKMVALWIKIDRLFLGLNLSKHYLIVAEDWLVFALYGTVIGLCCAVFLGWKFRSLIWRMGLGLMLGSLIGSFLGGLGEFWLDSVELGYPMVFVVMGLIFGGALAVKSSDFSKPTN